MSVKPVKPLQLLIFDLDGTLIDSVPDLAVATNAMLQDLGRRCVSTDDVRNWVGNGSRKLVQRALSNNIDIDPHLERTQTDTAEALFFQHYAAHTCVHTQAYAGVSTGLIKLKDAGFVLALVTNKPVRYVPNILQHFDWQDVFAMTLGGDSLAEKKPHPMPLLHVCEQLHLCPEQSAMIGDSRNDILAGQRAGMMTLGLSYGYNYGQDIRDFMPTQAFDGFADLTQFLLTLDRK